MKKNTKSSKIPRNSLLVKGSLIHIVLPYVLLVLISILPLIPFFHAGLPITHDGKDHVARIADFYQNLEDGVLIPRWAENLNWGYGHPILMFLYPLPSYFASLFRFFGFSFIDSVKVVFICAYVLSGLTMYLWISKIFNKKAGFIAAILYLFAPYRFVDLQVRGAFGEHVAFIFPPLVMYFLFKLSQKMDVFTLSLGAISLAGLLLSHNAISVMFIPIFLLYSLFIFLHTEDKKKFVLYITLLFFLGFSLASFFWLPALLEGKYTLRDIVTSSDYATRFVPFMDFIYREWSFGRTNSLSKEVGVIHWIVTLITLFIGWMWYKRNNSLWQLACGSILVFVASLFIMMSPSQILWDNVKILQNFQFPWRFLTVVVFITSFCGGLVIYAFAKKMQIYAVVIVGLLAIVLTSTYWGVNGYFYKPDSYFGGIYEGTTDTGESAPIWSVRFMEKRPRAHIEVIEGKGKIVEGERKTTSHIYTTLSDEKIRLRENTLYFPGWQVLVDNVSVQPEFQDTQNRGLMTFYVQKGTHDIRILFTDTKIRLVANIISLFSLVIVGFFCIMKIGFLWKRFQ